MCIIRKMEIEKRKHGEISSRNLYVKTYETEPNLRARLYYLNIPTIRNNTVGEY